MKKVFFFLLIISSISCSKVNLSGFSFLEGTWKINNEEKFEYWEKENSDLFIGFVYKWIEGKRVKVESLSIRKISGEVIYEATVPNQNNGKPIRFELVSNKNDSFVFQNLKHDFPKRIIYEVLSKDSINVTLIGENEEFNFKYVKVKKE